MKQYSKNIFSISLFEKKIDNWQKKQRALINISDKSSFFKGGDGVTSDFYTQQDSHNEAIKIIFKEEMDIFLNEIKASEYYISNSWFEKAHKGEYHGVHNHGQLGYSAVCYIIYDNTVHTPTQFISPINNINDGGSEYYTVDADEGKLIIFPSMLLHYTIPNDSEKERLIMSFNFRVK